MRIAGQGAADLVLHARKAVPGEAESRRVVFELTDRDKLVQALSDCTTVVQLIGTMRKRFASGDTYESSDVGTTRLLTEAARETQADHFVLLSSVGASPSGGAYLAAKARAEEIVRCSGIPYTIFRPSALIGREGPGAAGTLDMLFRGVGWVMGALGLTRMQPIETERVAAAILACARRREPLEVVLEGAAIRRLAAASP